MLGFVNKHKVLVVSTALAGIGVFAIRRYFAGPVCTSKAQLDGKTVIITGANTGIGRETARDMAERGARVILACRDLTKAERAAEDIRKSTGNPDVHVKVVDLASLQSVRKFAQNIISTEKHLDILINNAGVMGTPQWRSEDGFELQFAVNHLSHFLLTNLLLDLLKASAPSRVVNVSSIAHAWGSINLTDINAEGWYDPFRVYSQSKLANILFTLELHNRVKGSGVTVYSLHPGAVKSELMRYTNSHIPVYLRWIWKFLMMTLFKTPFQGAQTSIYCAVQEGIEEHSGKYFSDCHVKTPSPQAQEPDMARQLWELSERMVKLKS